MADSGDRSNNATVKARVMEVYRLLIAGATRRDILQFASESGWNKSSRQVDFYIKKANEWLDAEAQRVRAGALAKEIIRSEDLYAKAMNQADYRAALAIARDKRELLGLYPAKPGTFTLEQVTEATRAMVVAAMELLSPQAREQFNTRLGQILGPLPNNGNQP